MPGAGGAGKSIADMKYRLICISLILFSFVAQLSAGISLSQLPTVFSPSGNVSYKYSDEGCLVTATGHDSIELTVHYTDYYGNSDEYFTSGINRAEIMVPAGYAMKYCESYAEFWDYDIFEELSYSDEESLQFDVLPESSSEYMNKPINFCTSAYISNGEIKNYDVYAWPEYVINTGEMLRYGIVMKRNGVETGAMSLLNSCSIEIPENGTGGVTYNMSAVNRLELWSNGECVARLDSDPTYYSKFIHERLWKHFERGRDLPFNCEVCVYGQGEEGSRTDHVEVCAREYDWDPVPEGFFVIPDVVDVGSYRSTIDAYDTSTSFSIYIPDGGVWEEVMPSASPIEMQFGPTVSPVTVIRAEAFKNNEMLTGVEIGANVTFIGKEAFAGCTNLDTVRCMAEVPPVMEDENCFDCYKTATLVVPEGSIDAYKNADWWKKFFHNTHIDIVKGDVNKDGRIDINDVMALIGYLLDGHADPFDEYQADVNYDNNIDINDVTLLINWVLGRQ